MPDDELAMLARRIDCPVPWCSGLWIDHGGDGADPGQWLHEDEHGTDLPHGAFLGRSQLGGGPVEWSLTMRGDGAQYSMFSAGDPAEFAQILRDIADAISPDA